MARAGDARMRGRRSGQRWHGSFSVDGAMVATLDILYHTLVFGHKATDSKQRRDSDPGPAVNNSIAEHDFLACPQHRTSLLDQRSCENGKVRAVNKQAGRQAGKQKANGECKPAGQRASKQAREQAPKHKYRPRETAHGSRRPWRAHRLMVRPWRARLWPGARGPRSARAITRAAA